MNTEEMKLMAEGLHPNDIVWLERRVKALESEEKRLHMGLVDVIFEDHTGGGADIARKVLYDIEPNGN